jgi:thioredoxin reductase (NADPH)
MDKSTLCLAHTQGGLRLTQNLDFDLGIIGAGPAGLSAAIYGKRAGLDVLLLDMDFGGGTVTINPMVENYLGIPGLTGAELAAKFRDHAEKYVQITMGEHVSKLNVEKKIVSIQTDKNTYSVGAVILAMGTEHRKLGVPGEEEFLGKGVSYCATCDGAFFRDKKIAVVGGGNSAAIEAMYLRAFSDDISLIHRRDQLRAEEFYADQLKEKGVNLILEAKVKEFYGAEVLQGVKIYNKKNRTTFELPLDGVFVSIGTTPRSNLVKDIGVKLDKKGYIKVDQNMQTNVNRVFAAGDITGGVRQIITAAAEGATAALSTLEVLGKQYPFY